MTISSSRRGFLKGIAGLGLAGAAGCQCPLCGEPKIKLAVVGVGGKGYSDWTPMLKTGMAEIVAFCDVDANTWKKCLERAKNDGFGDLSDIPFYTDYRKLLKDSGILGIQAMTISTPDHVHAPVAIQAMKKGIHVYVQKPLVRTLGELKYFEKVARANHVIVQMGNQGSALNSMRRCTEILQSGILGEVKEVHVWTNRPVWPQGKVLSDYIKSRGDQGDPVPAGLDWDSFLATAKARPYLGKFPADLKFHNDWKIAPNVYHAFNWRGSIDFGAGAFGDMACHTMNLPFRGLELADVQDAECTMIEGKSDLIFPVKSIVKLTYRARVAKFGPQKGKKLPAVTLFWYDGDEKPNAAIMPKWANTHEGKVPNTGCFIIGSKGTVLMQDDYGAKCAIALNDDETYVDVFKHEAAQNVARDIPFCSDGADAAVSGSSVEMKGLGVQHYVEFLRAIKGIGPVYAQTNSRCFSDIAYCIPQMEGILVGVVAQQVPGKHTWNTKTQKFGDEAANKLINQPVRKGWEF